MHQGFHRIHAPFALYLPLKRISAARLVATLSWAGGMFRTPAAV
jgi:hypothetical protein